MRTALVRGGVLSSLFIATLLGSSLQSVERRLFGAGGLG